MCFIILVLVYLCTYNIIIMIQKVPLHLGCTLCGTHICKTVEAMWMNWGLHGLGCCKSQGHIPRHFELNFTIQRALEAVQFQPNWNPRAVLYGWSQTRWYVTIMAWSHGQALVWDASCRACMPHPTFTQAQQRLVPSQRRQWEINFIFMLSSTPPITSCPWHLRLLEFSVLIHAPSCKTWHLDLTFRIMICWLTSNCINMSLQRFNCDAILGTCL